MCAPSVFSQEIYTARRGDCECGRTITPGERYEIYRGIWEGKAGRYKTCVPCMELRREIVSQHSQYHEAPAFGELGEWAREEGYEWPPSAD